MEINRSSGAVLSTDCSKVAIPSVPLRIGETSSLNSLDRLAWNALVTSAPDGTVFQSFDWLVSWWAAFGGRYRALVLTAYWDTELVGAAPLLIDDTSGRPCIRFIGESHSDYLIFPVRSGATAVAEQLLDHLEHDYGARYDIHLLNVPDDSALGLLLQQRGKSLPLRLLRTEITPCPRLKIKGNDLQVEEVLKKKSLKRHAAKLATQGNVEVRHLTERQEILVQLEQFFEQHRCRWAVTPFPSLFEAEADRCFYRNLVQSGLCDGSLIFTTISVDGCLAACHFGLLSRADFLWYKPSFDVRLSQLSPGEVLLRELLMLAQKHNYDYLDFTRGDEFFKARFSSEVRYNGNYLIYAKRIDAVAAHLRDFIKGLFQRCLGQNSLIGRYLRQLKLTFSTAREQGAGLRKAVLTSLWLAGNASLRWLISRRAIHLFSVQKPLAVDIEQELSVREADLGYLLDSSDRLAEIVVFNKQFLADAYKRLARGERCFVIERQDCLAAVGWARKHSPHPVTEVDAALHFPEQAIVLYDFYTAQGFRGQGLYSKLLLGMRAALGAVPLLIYAEDSNIASLKGIRRAGFTLEAVIENHTVLGHRRLTVRLSCPQTLSWRFSGEKSLNHGPQSGK